MTALSAFSAAAAYGRAKTPEARYAAPPGANGLDPRTDAKLKANAQDFEAVFLETLVDRMYGSLGKDGPLGGEGAGGEVWRSMLSQQHAKTLARSGGGGLAASVYDELVKIQARASGAAATGKARP